MPAKSTGTLSAEIKEKVSYLKETAGFLKEIQQGRLDFPVVCVTNRGAGNHNELDTGFHFRFIQAVRLSKKPACAVSDHCATDSTAGHNTNRALGAGCVQRVENSQTTFDALAIIVDATKLDTAL